MTNLKIAIIGAGFTGLSAALNLQRKGYDVTLFEADENPGGLAVGFKDPSWKWSLEKHYHHFFTNDNSIKNLAKKINYPLITKRAKTSVFIKGKVHQLDSPLKLLLFQELFLFEKVRMAIVLGFLKYNPFWLPLEKFNAETSLKKFMGKIGYDLIWGPQMKAKFGEYSKDISLAWFWARIKKRTSSLSYPEKGFLGFAKAIEKEIVKNGGKFSYSTRVTNIKSGENVMLTIQDKTKTKQIEFDKVIVTLPTFLFEKLTREQLPKEYIKRNSQIKGIGAINMVVRLKNKFFNDNTYWLSICESTFPFMAVVEHTNFIEKKNYNNERLLYVGKYLKANHKYFSKSREELMKIYKPYLMKINKDFEKSIIDYEVFKAPFAQPIIPTNYSKMIPPFKTPLKNVYLANIQQVYPWDRGTNYAVELGEKIAKSIDK